MDELRTTMLKGIAAMAATNQAMPNSQSEQSVIAATQIAASNGLKDPGAAQFRTVRVVAHYNGRLVCGEINGKNGFGAYVGFREFVGSPGGAMVQRAGSSNMEAEETWNAILRIVCKRGPA